MPVEPGHVFIFARSVGDSDPVFREQLSTGPGQRIVVPPTFTRAAEHYDFDEDLRLWPGGTIPEGGGTGRFHAEQHFEYLKPMTAGDCLTARTYAGSTWTKQGRSGPLEFVEVLTDFYDSSGDLVVRASKVSVRVDIGSDR
jgi:hypothetical protein